ncbi:hypothetical protein [Pedobacter cryoconitis]|uniref:Uncharacterized protein n=1 Tax=Pedobacter cryoconitis TaxID=188932 RepID=A0A327T6P7_9SPHI|nr:hypothetical protein [Pedobacter cryoconitis]RAJ35754.1 hypothetical protein LY11_01001 [Pedobacter cryoconitis]
MKKHLLLTSKPIFFVLDLTARQWVKDGMVKNNNFLDKLSITKFRLTEP